MSKRVDGSLGTLLQGVSQQPAKERLSGQVTVQDNMTADVVKMLSRRAPSQFVNKLILGDVNITKVFVHFYSRGDGEQYFIIIAPGGVLKVFDLDGVELSLDVSSQFTSYITDTNPKDVIRMTTVGDYTYVVNNTVTVDMDSALSTAALSDSGRITVKSGNYSRDYTVRITVNGTDYVFTHTTPDSSAVANEADIATDVIASELKTLISAETDVTDEFDVLSSGAYILLLPLTANLDYAITTLDGTGGGALAASDHNIVSSLTDLPTRALDNEVYLVKGGGGDADDLFMRFTVEDSPSGNAKYFKEGRWIEGIADDTPYRLDADTMPHLMLRTSGGSVFACGAAGESPGGTDIDAWANRLVGNETSNKDPQFVGSKLADVISFQDRLVLLDEEGVNFSVTRDFFNFWKKTVSTLLADGPIGVTSASGQVNILRYAAQHDKDLIIFADKVQFTIFGSVAITPSNATMVETTKFKIQSKVPPVPSGQNLFFAVDHGAYAGVREFYTDSTFDSNNARPITVAVERYITGSVRQLSSATNLNKLTVIADEPNIVFLYEYLWDEGERLQTSWSRWIFRDDMHVLHCEFVEDSLYVLGYIGTELHVLDLALQRDTFEEEILVNETLQGGVCLDHRTVETVAVSTVTGLDHLPADVSLLDAIQGEGCPHPGMRAVIASWDGSTLVFKADMGGGTVFIGTKYTSRVTPTQPYVRDRDGRPILTSDLTVGSMYINYNESGDFNVDVTAEYSYTERNPGRILGSPSSTLGEFRLTEGSFPVPVRARNTKSSISVWSDSPYPFTISDIEWDGKYNKRGTRMSTGG